MAKKTKHLIRMVSEAGTGTFFVRTKNPKTKPEKMELKKFDKKTRKHEVFKEAKIK